MADNFDLTSHDPYTHFTTISNIQNQINKNSADIAALQAKLNLLSPKDISKLQIDVNNLQNKDDLLKKDILNTTQDLTSLTQDLGSIKQQATTDISTINGQINQMFLAISDLKKRVKDIQLKVNTKPKSIWSNSIFKDIFVGVAVVIILSFLGYIGKICWDLILERETGIHTPQITFTQPKNLNQQNINLKNNK